MVHFILVYRKNLDEEKTEKLESFKSNLIRMGIELETVPFSANPNIHFIKISASNGVIIKYAPVCNVYLYCKTFTYRVPMKPPLNFMATPLTNPNENEDIYERAPEFISGDIPKNVTSAETILVLHNLMMRVKFGEDSSDFGYEKMQRDGILLDSFPVHKGNYFWKETGPLNDRQLLYKFWGNFKCWYKEQPLNCIERYYGSEYAFYFAWLGFYTKMLIPIAIFSLLATIYGVVTIPTALNHRSHEICNSEVIMCPICHFKSCKFEKLSSSCLQSHLTYLCDNPVSLILAVVVMFWSTIFMEFWQRSEAVLQLQWNVKDVEKDTSLRYEYIEAANKLKYSPLRDEFVPRVSKVTKVKGYLISTSATVFLLILMIAGVFGVMVYRIAILFLLMKNYKGKIIFKNYHILVASVTGSFISAIFMVLFRLIYWHIALLLTRIENHRTEYEFDTAFIYKLYALAFTNNYSPIFYIIFFKGKFYTHPGDNKLWTQVGGAAADTCGPPGCILDLGVQMICIMLVKIFCNNITQVVSPLFTKLFKKFWSNIRFHEDLPNYEEEYLMAQTHKYFLVEEYLEMVIQYGYVIFFVAGFPLAPFFALLNNILEIRIDASKLTKNYRRPVPKKVAGLGAWFSILQGITYLGVVTNAVVIAFLSNAIPVFISGEKRFLNESLSEYALSDFTFESRSFLKKANICLYHGRRYPPEHPRKYQLNADFWYLLSFRFIIVLLFEHVVIVLNGILAYAIPDVPAVVTEQLAREEKKNKEIRSKFLKNTIQGNVALPSTSRRR